MFGDNQPVGSYGVNPIAVQLARQAVERRAESKSLKKSKKLQARPMSDVLGVELPESGELPDDVQEGLLVLSQRLSVVTSATALEPIQTAIEDLDGLLTARPDFSESRCLRGASEWLRLAADLMRHAQHPDELEDMASQLPGQHDAVVAGELGDLVMHIRQILTHARELIALEDTVLDLIQQNASDPSIASDPQLCAQVVAMISSGIDMPGAEGSEVDPILMRMTMLSRQVSFIGQLALANRLAEGDVFLEEERTRHRGLMHRVVSYSH